MLLPKAFGPIPIVLPHVNDYSHCTPCGGVYIWGVILVTTPLESWELPPPLPK